MVIMGQQPNLAIIPVKPVMMTQVVLLVLIVHQQEFYGISADAQIYTIVMELQPNVKNVYLNVPPVKMEMNVCL
jgi:hypothetical protein